jgi:TonB family protein
VCDWDGPTRVQLVVKGGHVTARVRATNAGDDDDATSAPAEGETLPSNFIVPEGMREFLLHHGSGLKPPGRDSAAVAKRGVTPASPAPRDTARTLSSATIAPGSAVTAPSAAPAAPSGAARVPTLRDTLRMPTAGDPDPRVGPYPVPVMAEPRSFVAYPEQARDAGVQGLVRVLAHVDTAGVVTDVTLVHGIAELNAEALRAARAQRFVPYRFGGVVYAFYVIVPYRFTIH